MNKLLIATAASVVFAGSAIAGGYDQTQPASAQSDNNMYVSGLGGVTIPMGRFAATTGSNPGGAKVGFGLGAAVGYQFSQFRVEGAFNWFRNSINTKVVDGHCNSYLYTVNGLYDFNLDSSVTPYVGLGLGALTLSYVPKSGSSSSKTGFAVQGIIGATYKLSDNLGLGAEYHLVYSRVDGDNLYTNLIAARINYSFAV